jgi:prophage antirepressor-like protein
MADWNKEVTDAAERAEAEVKRLIRYLNDEVVPEVRQHGSSALRSAAEQLSKLAEKMDDRK